MTGKWIAAALCMMAAAPASAMTVQLFLDKADALQKKGMAALFSPDIGVLKAEGKEAVKSWRAQAPRIRPAVCPPPAGQKLSSDEVLAMLRALPPAERARLSVHDGLHRQLNAKYRCR
jgi:hypothetical protein